MPPDDEPIGRAPYNETYLGDGLYASFDGWMITLRAPREHGDHFVGMEPAVWIALRKFAEECYRTEIRVGTGAGDLELPD